MKTKKLLSLLLAVMMMLSVVPFYASAEAVALTVDNVVTWPTADKEIYYGQTAKNEITLVGGVVTSDGTESGTVIPGTWEFTDADDYLPATGTRNSNIRFVPSNSDLYSGFEVANTTLVKYKVNKLLPVLVDENNPPVATEVEAGAKLSTSTLSGGQVKNPYNPDEPKALAGVWRWTKTSTVVNESGYYQARMVIANYEVLYMDVYVKIASDIPETTIAEYPTIPELTYNPDVTWADIALTGGKAVIKGTDTEVAGTFAIKDTRLSAYPNPNFTEIEVVFTPANAEEALPYEFTIPVKVNPLPISFKGEDGNYIVDGFVFEVAPGTKMSDVESMLKAHLNAPKNSVLTVEDYYGYAENGRTYKLTVSHDDPNYVGKEVSFTVKFKEVEFTPTFKSGYLNSAIDCGDYSPAGTFTVSLDGKEIAVVKANERFTYTVENSGDYVLSAKYNPVENDYFVIADATQTVNVKLQRRVNRINCTSSGGLTVTYGDTVTLSANATNETFDRWVITDANGNEVDLGIDLTALNLTFTMPDCNITAEAKLKGASSDDSTGSTGGIDDILGGLGDLGNLTEGDSDNAIVNVFNNIIAWIKNIINTIIELFRSIGDNT